jgi:hypothetical protein
VVRNPGQYTSGTGSSGLNPKRKSIIRFTTNGYNEIIES